MTHLLSKMMLAGFAFAMAAQPALAAEKTCLALRDISSSEPNKDGTAVTFQMRDGRLFHNDLQGDCSDLKYEGFTWAIPGSDKVCEDQQTLKVIRSGQVCQLGKFTQMTPAPRG